MLSKKRKFTPIRWTFERAGAEFGHSPRTISKRVTGAGIVSGEDGKFSTQDIAKALFDLGQRAYLLERTKSLRLANKQAAWKLREREGTWVHVDEMVKRLTPMLVSVRQVILSSEMDQVSQDAIFDALSKLLLDAVCKEPEPAAATDEPDNSDLTEKPE